MPAIHQQGRSKVRDAYSGIVSHIGISTDQTAFSDGDTVLDPANAGGTTLLIKAATIEVVDGDTFDASISIDGNTEFTEQTIWTIGNQDGATRADNISRTVRTQGIGVQAGDLFTIGTRNVTEDNTV